MNTPQTTSRPLDLSFRPAPEVPGRRLTAAQIAHYNREGFVQPFDIFPPAEIARIRGYIDRLMTDMGEAGGYGINCYQGRLAGLWDIATDPRILDHVEDIIGPDIICWASAVLSKRPQDPKRVPWHQDASFWSLSPARTVTVWLAIDDADEANSAMQFIPRTHAMGALATASTDGEAVFHKGTADAETLGTPFTNSLRAGQISLHADMLVHGSGPNRSDRRRCGLTLRYCPPEVRITDPVWARGVEAIICRGGDPSGHWRHTPRPDNDDIRRTASPHVVGNN
jgi:non-heme Fe2+,alpha-ketoglutarate-dependent halogenase